ncbi:MAG TPA: hypothetical protein VK539_23045 [Myxococcaceae bacterium]|nr:hypothetical protein [Myxococcaceae bacterium]
MRWLLFLSLVLGLSACRSRPGAAEDMAPQPLQAQVLDGGVAGQANTGEVAPWDVKGRVLPVETHIGEAFTYELVFTHAKDQRFELVAPKELEQFEVLEQSRQRQDGADGSVTTYKLKMSAFELGSLTLPQLVFELTAPGVSQSVAVPGMKVDVLPTLPQNAEDEGAGLYDYRAPIEVPIRSWKLVWILLGLVAACLLGWALVKWLRRPRPETVAVKPLAPLDIRTREALDRLKGENLPAKGHVKDFYFRLSEIIRGYLGERYGFEALECTSSELFDSLRKRNTAGLPEDRLMRFVSESDMVKYAKAEASAESCAASLAFGYELVETTYTPPTPSSPTAPDHAPGTRVS